MTIDELLRRADAEIADDDLQDIGRALIRDLAAALLAEQEHIVALTERAERAEADLFQARQVAFQEGVGRAAVERERDEARALLREARDSVAEEVDHNRVAWGDRLMHKQKPAIDLLARIDAALKDKGTP